MLLDVTYQRILKFKDKYRLNSNVVRCHIPKVIKVKGNYRLKA